MSPARRKIQFQGLLKRNVLGTFTVIRGFADLRDLAEVSIAMPYEGSGLDEGRGYQRSIDEDHVEDIKRFLKQGRYRFFPEIILSLRSKSEGETVPVVSLRKKGRSKIDGTYVATIDVKSLHETSDKPIRRIDGNHRLEAAVRFAKEQPKSATFKDFTTAPFCFVILDSNRPQDDDLAEAMLFNFINSKALPLVSEHSLSVLMSDDGTAAERFGEDRQVFLTRLIRDSVLGWPEGFYDTMGKSPLSRLYSTARVLLRPGAVSAAALDSTQAETKGLFDPVSDLATRLRDAHESFVLSEAFLPIACEIYVRHSRVDAAQGANTRQARL